MVQDHLSPKPLGTQVTAANEKNRELWARANETIRKSCEPEDAGLNVIEHPGNTKFQKWVKISIVQGKFTPGWEEGIKYLQEMKMLEGAEHNQWLSSIAQGMMDVFGRLVVEEELQGWFHQRLGIPPAETSRMTLEALASLLREISQQRNPPSESLPNWINKQFRAKQHKLLKLLWGQGEVSISSLLGELYAGNATKREVLHALKGRVGIKLLELELPYQICARRDEFYVLESV